MIVMPGSGSNPPGGVFGVTLFSRTWLPSESSVLPTRAWPFGTGGSVTGEVIGEDIGTAVGGVASVHAPAVSPCGSAAIPYSARFLSTSETKLTTRSFAIAQDETGLPNAAASRLNCVMIVASAGSK